MQKTLFTRGLLLFLVVILGQVSAFAQSKVGGTVTDANGEPIIGASVSVKGGSTGAVTDIDGNYSIADVSGNATLVFSYVGFVSQEVQVNNRSTINIKLLEDNNELNEVVVVGYGTMKKSDLTGSVSDLQAKDFNKGLVTSPSDLLQGRTAGVNITSNGGEPGGGVTIRVRGSNSIRSGQDPLYVIDGVPLDASNDLQAGGGSITGVGSSSYTNPLNYINADDIETITVLKDASASAIYGSRAANGVVLITTKKNTQGKAQVNYTGSVSVSYLPKKLDMLNASEYKAFAQQKNVDITDLGHDTDWQDEIFRTSFSHNHNLSISGGNANGGYRASGNIQVDDGIIKTTGLKKYTARFYAHQYILNNRVHIEGSVTDSRIVQNRAPLGESGGYEGDLLLSALKLNPTFPVFNEDGTYYQNSSAVRNPVAMLNLTNDETQTDRVLANVAATVDLFKGLKYKFSYALDRMKTSRRITQDQSLIYIPSGGEAYINNVESRNYLIENYFTYDFDINKIHKFNILAGQSYQKYHDYWYSMSENGFNVKNVNYLYDLKYGNYNNITGNSDVLEHELQSFYGRINYNLMDKYLLTANFRWDGSTRFGENNKYGFFPSVALAWRLSEENFIKKLNVFDNLKLRLGYGVTGNQEIPDRISQLKLGTVTGAFIDGSGTPTTGITLTRTPNPDLKWENTRQFNVGVDFGFFDSRLTGSIDYYYKSTRNVLLQIYSIAPAPTTTMWSNVDGMRINNKGIEVTLNGDIIRTKDFDWSASLNFAHNSNVVKGLPMSYISVGQPSGPGFSEYIQRIMDNEPLGTFYGPHFLGFDDQGHSIYEKDADGNVVKRVIGNAQPDFTLNFSTTLSYKNWSLSMNFNGMFGQDIYNNLDNVIGDATVFDTGFNITKKATETPEAMDNSLDYSDRFIEDGSFLRLASAQLSYQVPIKPNNWLKGLTLTLTGNNLFCITGYSGYDPEVDTYRATDGIPAIGVGWTNYPKARSFTFGASLNF